MVNSTDKNFADIAREKGRLAKLDGKSAEDCSWNGGLAQRWWMDGFNGG